MSVTGASAMPGFVLPGAWPSGGIRRRAGLRTPSPSRGVGVQVSPWSLFFRGVDWRLVPARSHKPSHVGSNPTSATAFASRVRKPVKRPGRELGDCLRVRFPPRLLRKTDVAGRQERQARSPRRLSPRRHLRSASQGLQVLRPHAPSVEGKIGFNSRADLRLSMGAHVPRGRDCLASRLRWVQFPSSPLDKGASDPMARDQPGVLEMRVQFPRGPLTTPMVKRISSLASNETFRVRLPGGVLLVPWPRGRASP